MSGHVVILGGGIVGCATAFYLRKLGGGELKITIVDRVGIAAAASGRAGGFLARDWHSGPAARLAGHSFGLHAELASEFGAEQIGYRSCRAVQPTCAGGQTKKSGSEWFDGCVGHAQEIAPRSSAAQVIPAKLTGALFTASRAELVVGAPVELKEGAALGCFLLRVAQETGEEAELACDSLLLACGPWTSQVASQLGITMRAAVVGLKAHSVLLQPKSHNVDDSCLFMDWRGDPFAGEFELYPRLDGVYVCGCGESPCVVLEGPADVEISEKASACLISSAASVSSALDGATVLRQTACYLPCADTGSIVAGQLRDGIFVATGHTCWGILNGPATGQGMAELILGSKGKGAELLKPFAPRL